MSACGRFRPTPPGLEADEEDGHGAAGELGNGIVALLGLAGELGPAQPGVFEPRLDTAEHAGELREHQHAAAFLHHFGQHLHELLQLGRFLHSLCRFEIEQLRVAAHLAQLQERVEDGDVALGQALAHQRFAHGFLHP